MEQSDSLGLDRNRSPIKDQVVELSLPGGAGNWGITIGKTGESYSAEAPDGPHAQKALMVGKVVDKNLPVNWGINSIKVQDLTPEGKPDRVGITIGNLENPSLTRSIAVQLKDGWEKALEKEIKSMNLP
jgi:hypothetical protein